MHVFLQPRHRKVEPVTLLAERIRGARPQPEDDAAGRRFGHGGPADGCEHRSARVDVDCRAADPDSLGRHRKCGHRADRIARYARLGVPERFETRPFSGAADLDHGPQVWPAEEAEASLHDAL